MGYPDAAWRRAMTVQEVVLKALSGEIHWFRAAGILGMSARTLRRCCRRLRMDALRGGEAAVRHGDRSRPVRLCRFRNAWR